MDNYVRTSNKVSVIIVAALSALVTFVAPANAALSDDSLIEGAKLCTRYLPRHERQYGIPVHLLAAIASTESGRYHRALGLNLPWPWTINVEGKGYFFDSKQEAIAAVQKLQSRGFKSIDIGCMQVNLHHHPYAFSSLDQAFDPAYNVAYAAQFLKKNFEDEGSWRKAAGDYHSKTPLYGEQYARLVYGAWSRIINKVADARAGRPLLNAATNKQIPIQYHDKQAAQYASAVMQKPRATHHAPHMHEISVSHDMTSERGVLVVRPEHDIAQEKPKQNEEEFVVQASPAMPKNTVIAAAENKGAQIVKVHAGRVISAKGQFEPESHIVRVGNYALPEKVDANRPSKNAFVFDN